jgi:hypothetical protein
MPESAADVIASCKNLAPSNNVLIGNRKVTNSRLVAPATAAVGSTLDTQRRWRTERFPPAPPMSSSARRHLPRLVNDQDRRQHEQTRRRELSGCSSECRHPAKPPAIYVAAAIRHAIWPSRFPVRYACRAGPARRADKAETHAQHTRWRQLFLSSVNDPHGEHRVVALKIDARPLAIVMSPYAIGTTGIALLSDVITSNHVQAVPVIGNDPLRIASTSMSDGGNADPAEHNGEWRQMLDQHLSEEECRTPQHR